jgi:hypothetical protein
MLGAPFLAPLVGPLVEQIAPKWVLPEVSGYSGQQLVVGGNSASADLILASTSHSTKGMLHWGNSVYDEANQRLGIRTNDLES